MIAVAFAIVLAFAVQGIGTTPSALPEVLMVCGLPLILLGGLLFWRLFQPTRRGRLRLEQEELVFRGGGKSTVFPLAEISRMGRRRNRIHLTLGPRSSHYFMCSMLHGEDMYDAIQARLDELGLEVTSHERRDT